MIEMTTTKLPPLQQAFVDEYIIDPNGTDAYIRAGYKARGAAARVGASKLLTNPNVQAAIAKARAAQQKRTEITADMVLESLARESKAGDLAEPNSARIRANELIGKHLGMFTERSEVHMVTESTGDYAPATPDEMLQCLREYQAMISGKLYVRKMARHIEVHADKYWGGHVPHNRQLDALLSPVKYLLYGGGKGGGKTDLMLMLSTLFAEFGAHVVLIIRNKLSDMMEEGQVIDRSKEWWGNIAKWNGSTHSWRFPDGLRVQFGFSSETGGFSRYDGGDYQMVLIDEGRQISPRALRYIVHSLVRSTEERAHIPLRTLICTNPGGKSGEWMREAYIDDPSDGYAFVQSLLDDNPYLTSDYRKQLEELDPYERAQLLHGDWNIRPQGNVFRREDLEAAIVDVPPPQFAHEATLKVRTWDTAATAPKRDSDDPDYTAGGEVWMAPNADFLIADMRRTRSGPTETDEFIVETAKADGQEIPILIETVSSGDKRANMFLVRALFGWDITLEHTGGANKLERARSVSGPVAQGRVYILRGAWNHDMIEEMVGFPSQAMGMHDDQVDCLSQGFKWLTEREPMESLSFF